MICDECKVTKTPFCLECERELDWKKVPPASKIKLMSWASCIKKLNAKSEIEFWDWGESAGLDPIDMPKRIWGQI